MIGIVTDSTSDIPSELAEAYKVIVVPAYINIGSKSYRDNVDISRAEIYSKLPVMRELPTTSATSPGDFVTLYDNLLRSTERVVSIHAASQLTAIYSSASLAAQQVDSSRITVIDSGQISMGLGLPVLSAGTCAMKGASIEAVLNSVAESVRLVKLFAVFDTMKYLAKSGRINIVRLGLSTLLDIKPVIELAGGRIELVARVRTWAKAKASLVSRFVALAPFQCLAVLHTDMEGQAHELMTLLKELGVVSEQNMIASVTPVIGIHTGPGALGISAIRKM